MTERVLRSMRWLAVLSLTGGGCALLLSWIVAPPPLHIALVFLGLAALVAENAAVVLSGRFSASLLLPLALAATVLLGPTAAGIVVLLGSISVDDLRRRVGLQVVAFNVGQLLLTVVVSGWLYLATGGRTLLPQELPLRGDEFPDMLFPLLILGLSSTAINAVLVGAGFIQKYGVSFRTFWNQNVRSLLSVQLSLTVLAVSIAQVMAVEVAGLALFIFPLLVSRQVHVRYQALTQSYVDTVRSLVAALEAKDRYTAGHSERVATYAVDIARSMQLPDEIVERIDLAAQVHDLGKVGIPDEVLSKPGRLTAAEFDLIRNHPEDGAEIVARVPGLAHIVPIVRHHHERFDGAGYCRGLAGDDIPIEARILAVADSFDAMTSSRAYRPAMEFEAAIAEMKTCAGTQFDAEIVEHFVGLLSSTREAGE